MKKNILYTGLAALVLYSAPACKKIGEFDDQYINNPNPRINTIGNTSQLLTNLLYRSSGRGAGGPVNGDLITLGDKEAALFVQYISEAIYPSAGLYTSTFGEWSTYYTGPLMDLAFIINYNRDAETKALVAVNGSNNNQLATARIWRAYLYSLATDRWGDIPYSDAGVLGLNTPKYDAQRDIYVDLFKELKEAADQFDNGAAFKGDILFNGNQTKWKKFANSLRMIMALRLSKVDATLGKAEFASAYGHAAGYISTNADNAAFTYLNNLNFRNPWNNQAFESNAFGMSTYFIDSLKAYSDPRLSVYANPSAPATYSGIPYGLNSDHLGTPAAYSEMGTAFTARNAPGYFITAAQMLLVRAEAGMRGWITGTVPKDDYENAIRASMQQNGIVNTTAINNYIASARVAFNPANATDAQRKISTQKYIALFPNGYEAFAEWRRTGYPVLTPAPDALNASKQIPRRWGYPTTEATLNATNYQKALGAMGGTNSTDNRVWWDKP
jgi:hypothetical protein